ncbi:metal-dependent transcriptional regulator [Enterococcus italicus]|jgi:Mn-dependent DtxR family transcriptional regulator|uniref:metal-dependent transcriptional regulator n=1 Tax=Enterococcus italicus TaxID=246144 RepID=UPI0028B11A12|nr:hypothetical protein [Enterococcus italicus]
MRIFSVEKEEYSKLVGHYQMRDGIARTGVLAKKLGITKSSVTEMFQRLAEEDFVKYTAYQGVSLTEISRTS